MGKITDKLKRCYRRIPELLKEWRWMCRYIRKYWVSITAYVCIGLIAVVMGFCISLATRDLMNAVIPPDGQVRQAEPVIRAMSLVIGMGLGQILFNALASWITVHVNTRITNEIRQEIFEKTMTSRWEALRAFHSGEILNRLEGDVGSVVDGVVNFIPGLITNLFRFIGAFLIIMWVEPMMAVVALASAPVLLLTAKPLMKIMRKYSQKQREVNGKILSFNEEAFQNIQLVKAFDLTRQRCEALIVLLKEHRRLQLEYSKVSIWVGAALSAIGLLAGYGCYGLAVYYLYKGRINYGDMTMFLQLSSTLSGAFNALVGMVPRAVSIATCAGRVMEITQLPAEADADAEQAAAMAAAVDKRGIRVVADRMCFTYEDSETPIMQEVSLTVNPGEICAFVGPSGGGKTTALRLMLGLLRPQSGSLNLELGDGSMKLPVSDSTRRLCAYVPQGNSVFSGTIEENLRAVAPNATDEQIEEALRVADAYDFVSAQPEGVRTVLGERGVNLSEGQLQRLAIARALLRDAPILIMDEATSALDVETESRVLHGMMKNNPNRIIIITTHRASMLDYCDKVIRVGDGSFETQETVASASAGANANA